MIDENHPLFDHLISTIAELLHEFNIDFNGFCDALRTQHVTNVYQQCKSFSQTALITGIDRRTISAIIKDNYTYHKTSPLPAVIDALKSHAQTHGMKLNKSGLNSLNLIIEQHTTTAHSTKVVIQLLMDIGIIQEQGNHYLFVDQSVSNDQVLSAFIDHLSQLMASVSVALTAEQQQDDQLKNQSSINLH